MNLKEKIKNDLSKFDKEDIPILFISSGMDSIYLLSELVDLGYDMIRCVHINIENNEHQSWIQKTKLKELISKIRHSKHTKIYSNMHSIFINNNYSIDAKLGYRPQISIFYPFIMDSFVYYPKSPLLFGFINKDYEKYFRGACKYCAKMALDGKPHNIQNNVLLPLIDREKQEIHDNLKINSKKHKINYMKYFWTCERPISNNDFTGYKPCNECNKCREFNSLDK